MAERAVGTVAAVRAVGPAAVVRAVRAAAAARPPTHRTGAPALVAAAAAGSCVAAANPLQLSVAVAVGGHGRVRRAAAMQACHPGHSRGDRGLGWRFGLGCCTHCGASAPLIAMRWCCGRPRTLPLWSSRGGTGQRGRLLPPRLLRSSWGPCSGTCGCHLGGHRSMRAPPPLPLPPRRIQRCRGPGVGPHGLAVAPAVVLPQAACHPSPRRPRPYRQRSTPPLSMHPWRSIPSPARRRRVRRPPLLSSAAAT